MLRARCIPSLLIAALLLTIGGCGPFFGMPSICEPGSESQKLTRAKKFDPYPDPNMGPAVVGGRPEGFMNPRPEASDFNKRGMPPWVQSYPPVAASYPTASSYLATGSYYPSSNVIAPPATAVYQPASSSYAAASASPYVAPASPAAAPAAAPNLVPLSPLPSSPAASQGNTTSLPGASYGSSTAPVAYGTKITAP